MKSNKAAQSDILLVCNFHPLTTICEVYYWALHHIGSYFLILMWLSLIRVYQALSWVSCKTKEVVMGHRFWFCTLLLSICTWNLHRWRSNEDPNIISYGEHILQKCSTCEVQIKQMWPMPISIQEKLYGGVNQLQVNADKSIQVDASEWSKKKPVALRARTKTFQKSNCYSYGWLFYI